MKAVVMAGGAGSRMRRSAAAEDVSSGEGTEMARKGLKGLVPLGGRPFLDYVIGQLLEADFGPLCLVIPPASDELRQYVERTRRRSGARVEWVVQDEPLGTAHAVLSAEEFVGDGECAVCNCDNLYPAGALAALKTAPSGACYVVGFSREALLKESNFGADRIASFAAIELGEDRRLVDIHEKPENPEQYRRAGQLWVNMNLYRFTPAIFEACRRIEPHPERGELELTAAVSDLAGRPETDFTVLFSHEGVVDLTSQGDIATATNLVKGREPTF